MSSPSPPLVAPCPSVSPWRSTRAGRYGCRMTSSAWGDGLATVTDSGRILDVWFPAPALGRRPAGAAPPPEFAALSSTDARRGTSRRAISVEIADLAAPPADTPDAYLRLHLLSSRLVRPQGLSMAGIFGVLPNVVWTSAGPAAPEEFERTRLRLLADGPVAVYGVDKFPRMVDYVIPAGVRIADADRVRLGAHLGRGHHGHARGLRQLQRRHARRVDGRGPHLGRRRRRRRLGRRRRRVDHGHAVRRRHRGDLDRRALPARRQLRHRDLARRRLHRRGRHATSPPA